MEDNSNNLKAIRKRRGLTIKEVSNGAKIPIRSYQNYEYGEREISVTALKQLADFYGVTTDYLLGREEQPEPLEQIYKMYDFKMLEKALSENYLNLPQEKREDFVEFLYRTVQLAKRDTTSAASEEIKTPKSEFADVSTEQLLQETEAREAELAKRDLSAFQKQDENMELA